jgi:hypothetical protein
MRAVAVLWRLRLRRRWRAWLALALLLGLGAGTGLACFAGARRTASAFGRIAEATRYPDISSSHGLQPAEAERIMKGFTADAGHTTVVGFTGFVEGLDRTLIKYFVGAWDKPLVHGRPVLRDGRYPHPDRPNEILVAGKGVDKARIKPGDTITMRFFLSDFSDMVSERFVVAGTGEAFEVAADTGQDRSAIYFTPAFSAANAGRLQAWSSTNFAADPARGGSERLSREILAAGWSVDENRSTVHTRVQDAIRPLVATLALLGGFLLVTTLVLVRQGLAREREDTQRESDAVLAIGVTRSEVGRVDLVTAAGIAVPGALLAVATAVALSPLSPVGAVRRLDPARGVSVDLTVLAIGALAVVVVLVAGGALRTHRSSDAERAIARPLFGAGLARPSMAGLRLAAGGTRSQRRRFWGTIAFSAAGLALVVAGVTFAGALQRLTEDTVRYGVGWELTARNAYGDISPDDVRELVADDKDIEGVAGTSLTQLLVEGRPVPTMPVEPITAALWPTVVRGRIPAADNEILAGADVLEALDAEIGDRLRLQSPFSPPGEGVREAIVVGTAVFPSIELAGIDPTRLGQGIAVTYDLSRTLYGGDFAEDLPDIILFDLADGVDPASVIRRYPDGMPELTGIAPTEWLPSLAPAEVIETDRASPLIRSVIGLLGLTVLATVAHTVTSGVRRQRGDYAVLKTLGFTRRQVLSAVTWQSIITMAIALLIALPIGTALGRTVWRLFAQLIGVIDTPVVPLLALTALTAVALAATALVATGPGLLAARTAPATVLREE